MNANEQNLMYTAGKILIMGVFRYTLKNGKNSEEIYEPKDRVSFDVKKDMYNQAVIRMGGRAAQEMSGLEVSTQKFYKDLEYAVPYMRNIANIEGKEFPEIYPNEYKYLSEEHYQIYILAAKYLINKTAELNNSTPELMIKKVAANIKLFVNDEFN